MLELLARQAVQPPLRRRRLHVASHRNVRRTGRSCTPRCRRRRCRGAPGRPIRRSSSSTPGSTGRSAPRSGTGGSPSTRPRCAMRLRWNTAQISASAAGHDRLLHLGDRRLGPSHRLADQLDLDRQLAGVGRHQHPVGVGEGQPLRPERVPTAWNGSRLRSRSARSRDRRHAPRQRPCRRSDETRLVDVVVGRHHVEALGQLHPVDGGQPDRQVLAPWCIFNSTAGPGSTSTR